MLDAVLAQQRGAQRRPVGLGDVAEVRDAGVVLGEELDHGGLDLRVRGEGAAEDGLHAQGEAAVPLEQADDARAPRAHGGAVLLRRRRVLGEVAARGHRHLAGQGERGEGVGGVGEGGVVAADGDGRALRVRRGRATAQRQQQPGHDASVRCAAMLSGMEWVASDLAGWVGALFPIGLAVVGVVNRDRIGRFLHTRPEERPEPIWTTSWDGDRRFSITNIGGGPAWNVEVDGMPTLSERRRPRGPQRRGFRRIGAGRSRRFEFANAIETEVAITVRYWKLNPQSATDEGEHHVTLVPFDWI